MKHIWLRTLMRYTGQNQNNNIAFYKKSNHAWNDMFLSRHETVSNEIKV